MTIINSKSTRPAVSLEELTALLASTKSAPSMAETHTCNIRQEFVRWPSPIRTREDILVMVPDLARVVFYDHHSMVQTDSGQPVYGRDAMRVNPRKLWLVFATVGSAPETLRQIGRGFATAQYHPLVHDLCTIESLTMKHYLAGKAIVVKPMVSDIDGVWRKGWSCRQGRLVTDSRTERPIGTDHLEEYALSHTRAQVEKELRANGIRPAVAHSWAATAYNKYVVAAVLNVKKELPSGQILNDGEIRVYVGEDNPKLPMQKRDEIAAAKKALAVRLIVQFYRQELLNNCLPREPRDQEQPPTEPEASVTEQVQNAPVVEVPGWIDALCEEIEEAEAVANCRS